MIKPKIRSYLVLAGVVLAGAPAAADTMVITYQSGRTQRVPMEEPSGEVSGLAYFKGPVPAVSDTKPKEPPVVPTNAVSGRPGPVQGGPRDQPVQSKGSGVTIKWAPPMGE